MRYQIRVAGKIFQGDDPRTLLKRAVEARRRAADRGEIQRSSDEKSASTEAGTDRPISLVS